MTTLSITLHTLFIFFFFNDTATTEIYTLSLHDALPICSVAGAFKNLSRAGVLKKRSRTSTVVPGSPGTVSRCVRSEEHTSELQSRLHLVCRLLLEKKKKTNDARQQELHD